MYLLLGGAANLASQLTVAGSPRWQSPMQKRLPLLQIMACRLAVIVVAVVHATHVEGTAPLPGALVRPVAEMLSLL